MRLSQRMCWALGAGCLAAGLGLPWAAAQMLGPVTMVEAVRFRPALVQLPGGSFLMGSPEGDQYADEDEQPQRLIEVLAFSICQTEVTQGQYAAVMGENPSNCEYGCGNELPVQNVSWYDAVAYLNKLTALESEVLVALGEMALTACYEGSGADVAWVAGCTGYRLPAEAEWEYAARAGTTTRWSFGVNPQEMEEYGWFSDNADDKVHSVGTKKANPWGLYDVHGNVWEWVWDSYGAYRSDSVVNSLGTTRTLRGGPFINSAEIQRSADREEGTPETRSMLLGLRCARGPGPQR